MTKTTRRNLLIGAGAAGASLMSTATAATAPTPADPALPLWRAWWAARCASIAAADRYRMAAQTIPEDLLMPRIQIGTDNGKPNYLYSVAQIGADFAKVDGRGLIFLSDRSHADFVEDWSRRRQAAIALFESRRIESARVRDDAGISALEAESEATNDAADDLCMKLEATLTDTPVSLGVRLHLAIEHIFARDFNHAYYSWSHVMSAARALSQQLPGELSVAIERSIESRERELAVANAADAGRSYA